MTNTLIPYSFIPGTKAKAQEVNANFIALANSITENTATLSSTKLNKDLSNITQTGVDTIKNLSVSLRNIGEIVTSSVPLTDAGLHLLDGALISGSGSYADFVTYIAGLVTGYPDLFETEANWQTQVISTGYCDKFVYDDTNNTIRLPKYGNQLIYNKSIPSTLGVKGNGIGIGLYNAGGNFGMDKIANSSALLGNPNAYGKSVGTSVTDAGISNKTVVGLVQNTANSGIVTDTSTIVENKANIYYYIVVATSTKTDIQVDIDEIATDLNGKADVDLSNVNNTGTSLGAGWAMPSDTYTDLSVGASETTYIAPANGYFWFKRRQLQDVMSIGIKNITAGFNSIVFSSGQSETIQVYIPAQKGQTVAITYNGNGDNAALRFIYAIGSESEAS